MASIMHKIMQTDSVFDNRKKSVKSTKSKAVKVTSGGNRKIVKKAGKGYSKFIVEDFTNHGKKTRVYGINKYSVARTTWGADNSYYIIPDNRDKAHVGIVWLGTQKNHEKKLGIITDVTDSVSATAEPSFFGPKPKREFYSG